MVWAGQDQGRDQQQETIGGYEGFRAGNLVGDWTDGDPMPKECMDSEKIGKGGTGECSGQSGIGRCAREVITHGIGVTKPYR